MFMRSESALGILGRGPGLTLSDRRRTARTRTLPPFGAVDSYTAASYLNVKVGQISRLARAAALGSAV
jgi:hypothetical protein